MAEKTVTELPAGPLYWHVENFPALADAEAAAGPLSLAADVEGKVWLFTLGPKGTPMHGGSMVTEIGPLVEVSAPEYLLLIAHGVAAPGATSGVHTHPGTEAFFVLEGQLSQKTPHGVNVVEAGKTLAGGAAGGSDGGHQQRRGRTALADHVRRGCEQAIRVGRYVRVRRLPSARALAEGPRGGLSCHRLHSMGFKPIRPTGNPMHFIKLNPPD